MNAILGSLMVLVTFMTLCNGQCTHVPRARILGDLSDDCRDNQGVKHRLNSKWKTDECEDCTCEEDGVHCCTNFPVPVRYNESRCKKILNKKTCTFTVVERNNPKKSCIVFLWLI